jgi:hypothetical protein
MKPKLKAPGTKRLKLRYDIPLSNCAFKFNLRHYRMALTMGGAPVCLGGGRECCDAKRSALEAGAYTRPLFGST